MTPPKGPAERAAERISARLREEWAGNPTDPKRFIAIIRDEYASIEQENRKYADAISRFRNSVTEVCAEFPNVADYLKQFEQENQRLREAVLELIAMEDHDCSNHSEMNGGYTDSDECAMCDQIAKLQALATDKRG